jgi:hypothetical protein
MKLETHAVFNENTEAMHMRNPQYELIDKSEMYKMLTGKDRFDSGNESTLGHSVNVKIEHVHEMDEYFLDVKKMEQFYNSVYSPSDSLPMYYKPCFERIDKAYSLCDVKKFKEGLQDLVDSIYWE